MSEITPDTSSPTPTPPPAPQEQEPQEAILSPQLLLYVALFGLILAIAVAFTQPTFGVVGLAGIGIAAMGLIGWVILNPEGARGFLTGRTVRFGGTSLIVTVLFLTALVALYSVIQSQDWQLDLTEQNNYSLTEDSRRVITALGADPSLPQVKVMSFLGGTQSGQRDQISVLLDEYVKASNGKISYEFVNPERDQVTSQTFSITRFGEVVVAPLDAEGKPDPDNAEKITSVIPQEQLTNAIMRATAAGDFRAYFLRVDGGLTLDALNQTPSALTVLNDTLKDQFDWTTEEVSLVELISGEVNLADEAADGTVLVIPGGTQALNDESLKVITDYLDAGGSAIIYTDAGFDTDGIALATADNFTAYLKEKFGVSFNRSIVLDLAKRLRIQNAPLIFYTTDFNEEHPTTAQFSDRQYQDSAAFVFNIAHPIDIEAAAPANVTVTSLINSGSDAYSKTLAQIRESQVEEAETDPQGPFPLVVSAENSETGSRLVMIGSLDFTSDLFQDLSYNVDLSVGAFRWASRQDELMPQVVAPPADQDTPIMADPQELSTINFVTVVALPFGVLGLGLLVWWTGRERAISAKKES